MFSPAIIIFREVLILFSGTPCICTLRGIYLQDCVLHTNDAYDASETEYVLYNACCIIYICDKKYYKLYCFLI